MNLRDLAWPIRIYWDLPVDPSGSGLCMKVCNDIADIKILFLSLRDGAPTIGQCCRDVLAGLKGRGVALSLSVTASAFYPELTALSVKTLLAEASSLDDVRSLIGKISRKGKEGLNCGISFEVGRGNYRELPDVVSLCIDNGIRDLVFPIQRLEPGNDVFYVGKSEREEISRRLGSIDHGKIRMTIHDPFLWEVFFPNADYHEGGCQAANSMFYISPSYKVYPCPAMPLELGDLNKTTLREIVMSEKKKKLRNFLLNPPGECAECDSAGNCLGGCRGRAYALTGALDRRDPACGQN